MVTDYAQQSPPPQRSHKKLLMTIIVVLLAGLTPLMVYYIRYKNVIHNKGKITKTQNEKTVQHPQKTGATKPQFDFYTLLPKMAVPLPHTKTTIPIQRAPNPEKR